VARVIPHARQALDHRRDPRQGPQICRESVARGTPPQCRIQLAELLSVQSGLPPRPPGPFQPPAARGRPSAMPPTRRHRRHIQRARHCRLRLPMCEQTRGSEAAGFQRGKVPSSTSQCWHLATSHRTR